MTIWPFWRLSQNSSFTSLLKTQPRHESGWNVEYKKRTITKVLEPKRILAPSCVLNSYIGMPLPARSSSPCRRGKFYKQGHCKRLQQVTIPRTSATNYMYDPTQVGFELIDPSNPSTLCWLLFAASPSLLRLQPSSRYRARNMLFLTYKMAKQ